MTDEQINYLDNVTTEQTRIILDDALETGKDFNYVGNGYESKEASIAACIAENARLMQ